MKYILLLLLTGCSAVNPLKLTESLTSDNKLAITLKKYQITTCKTTCLADEYETKIYKNPDTDIVEEYYECPLRYREFICLEIMPGGDGKHNVYKLSPRQWQQDADHLFGFYNHEEIKSIISEVEFVCEQDFAVCESHYEVIKALKQYFYERR